MWCAVHLWSGVLSSQCSSSSVSLGHQGKRQYQAPSPLVCGMPCTRVSGLLPQASIMLAERHIDCVSHALVYGCLRRLPSCLLRGIGFYSFMHEVMLQKAQDCIAILGLSMQRVIFEYIDDCSNDAKGPRRVWNVSHFVVQTESFAYVNDSAGADE